jgi:hypothetical protein
MSMNLIQNDHRYNINPEPSNPENFVGILNMNPQNYRVYAFRKESGRSCLREYFKLGIQGECRVSKANAIGHAY